MTGDVVAKEQKKEIVLRDYLGLEKRFKSLGSAVTYLTKQIESWLAFEDVEIPSGVGTSRALPVGRVVMRGQKLTYGASSKISWQGNEISLWEAYEVLITKNRLLLKNLILLSEEEQRRTLSRNHLDPNRKMLSEEVLDLAKLTYAAILDYDSLYASEYRRIYKQYGSDLADTFISLLKDSNEDKVQNDQAWKGSIELAATFIERYLQPSYKIASKAYEQVKMQSKKLSNSIEEAEALSGWIRREVAQLSQKQDLELKQRANELGNKLEKFFLEQERTLQERTGNLEVLVKNRHGEMERELESRRAALNEEQNEFFENQNRLNDEQLQAYLRESKDALESGFDSVLAAYDEKVSFTEPVKRWRSVAHWNIGTTIALGVILLLVSGAGMWGYYTLIKDMPNQAHELLDMKTIKSVALLFFLSAAYFYLVRTIVKMLFSTLHLARDAREREALTHVYLGLLGNDRNNFDENSRDIVYQALFSRSNTGLLGDDSSPTIPSASIGDLSRIANTASRLKS